jgi:hypothetical protein
MDPTELAKAIERFVDEKLNIHVRENPSPSERKRLVEAREALIKAIAAATGRQLPPAE